MTEKELNENSPGANPVSDSLTMALPDTSRQALKSEKSKTGPAEVEEEDDDGVIFQPIKSIKRQGSERVDLTHLLKDNMWYHIFYTACYGLGVW